MKLGLNNRKPLKLRILALLGSGGILFGSAGVPGCDSDVQSILVEGLEGASVSVLQALFQRITPDETIDDDGIFVPTV